MLLLVLLVVLSFLTSAMTAVAGLGGGIILIAFMPLMLPVQAIIPVHAVTQLFSNLSRAWFGRRQVLLAPLGEYFIGNFAGILLGSWLIQRVSLTHVPLFIGIYILLNVWLPAFQKAIARIDHFALIAFVQTVMSLFVGIAGAMTFPLLMKRYNDHNAIVSTSAAMMVFNHASKLIIFTIAGFAWLDYAWLLLGLIVAVSAGSWFGVRVRHRIRAELLRPIMKGILTVLAVHMIVRHVMTL